MIIVETISEIKEALSMMNNGNSSIGFVPTMGALHQGHISLIKKAKTENQVVVASIFVNPTQFNDTRDLENYPRTPEDDAILLSDSGCDLLFFPPVREIYPNDLMLEMDFGPMEKVMEGQYRPGHFKGVTTVVSRFFEIIKPARAYFGEKDFQQLAIIREMNQRLGTGVTVVGCETLRERDGLAMSSRNILLTPAERATAGIIYQTLQWLANEIRERPVDGVKKEAVAKITEQPGFKVQYLEVVDSDTLQPVEKWDPRRSHRVCIAVLSSRTRLIDNVAL